MAITRTPLVDDSGTGTDGTILNNAWKTELYDQIDAADTATAASILGSGLCEGRLTLTSGTPVTTADVTGATSVYWTPFRGNRIALYSGSAWSVLTFSELTLALGTVTSARPYDVFAYNNSGVVAVEKLAWTNATTRATALVLQDGVLVKSGATTRRYLGTFYTTSTTATEDSAQKRYVWNYYNRVRRSLIRQESTTSWTYTTATWRQANGSTANQVEVVTGWAEGALDLTLTANASNTNASVAVLVGIGVDSTTVPSPIAGGTSIATPAANVNVMFSTRYVAVPTIGQHFYAWLEISAATGTTTWVGVSNSINAGLVGTIEN